MSTATQRDLEAALKQGVEDGKIPNAIIYATNASGTFTYSFTTGYADCPTNKIPIESDATLMLASQTKLLTSISALQAVEQNHLTLDEDVTPHIPEIAQYGIITGFDDSDKPILEPKKGPITLRQLLTHSSGSTYMFTSPLITKHQKARGAGGMNQELAPTILERYDYPLAYEPGESWSYSPGLDWIGLLLKRLTGEDLETRFQKYIVSPLNLPEGSITFWPSSTAKIPQLATRSPTTSSLEADTNPTLNTYSKDTFGGHGAHAQIPQYIKIQRSLLADDGKLLKTETVKELFSPQLGPKSETAFNFFVQNFGSMLPGAFDTSLKVQYGLGGALQMEDWPSVGRRAGTLLWSGYYNPVWYIDRASDLAWTFGTNMIPPGDAQCKEMQEVTERALYKMLDEFKKGKQ